MITNILASSKRVSILYWARICGIHLILISLDFSTVAQSTNSCSSVDTNLCYASQPYPVVDFAIEKKFESIENTAVYQSPLLADIDGDCIPEIIMAGTMGYSSTPNLSSSIVILNSTDGTTLLTVPTAFYGVHGPTGFVVADVNNDGTPEFIVAAADHSLNPVNFRGRLVCYTVQGIIMWISNEQFGANVIQKFAGSLGLADFNQDGIPEVYIYNEIFNAQTGVKLCNGGANGIGGSGSSATNGTVSITVAGQLDDDLTDLELAAGYTIYKVSIVNTAGSAGNSLVPFNIHVDGSFRDGYTSIGDINNDGLLDVVVSSPGVFPDGRLYAYSLLNNVPTLLAKASPENGACCSLSLMGPPFVGDIDGSGLPSIGITRAQLLMTYKYNGTVDLQLNWSIETNDRSGRTGMTIFDFNQDGVQEIIYRDETDLRILDGSTNPPSNLSVIECFSGTVVEFPIVGDIDNTGQTKICVSCGTGPTGISGAIGKLNVFGAPASQQPWSPSRGIWNQYAYHVFNVNDDLTIPVQQLNNATYANGAYNNFYVQSSLLDEGGNFLQQVPELSGEISCVNYDWISNEYAVVFSVSNAPNASLSAPSGISVAFFDGDPQNNGNLIGTALTTAPIAQGDALSNLSFTFTSANLESLYMVVNSDGLIAGAPYTDQDFTILECSYANNIIVAQNLPLIEELNIAICANQAFNYYNTLFDESGVYYFNAQNENGCDSLVSKLNLVVHPAYSASDIVSACDTYTWPVNGQAYTTSGFYTEVVQTQFGCDSIMILELTINQSFTSYETVSSCEIYMWPVNGQTYTSSGTYSHQTISEWGCDSIAELNLTTYQNTSSETQATACDSYLWNGQTYTQSGSYTHLTAGSLGCDSTAVLNLIVNPSTSSSASVTACGSYSWNGQNFTQSGTYAYETFSSVGCDSIATLHLNINTGESASFTINACGSYTWPVNEQTYNQSGSYSEVLTTAGGCDSVVTVYINIQSDYNLVLNEFICEGQFYFFDGISLSESGTYVREITTSVGCDSIVTLNLTVDPVPQLDMDGIYTICTGQTAVLSGPEYAQGNLLWSTGETGHSITVSQAGDYSLTLNTPEECVVSAVATVIEYTLPDQVLNADFIFCWGDELVLDAGNPGSTYLWNEGITDRALQVMHPGFYTVLITNEAGCQREAFAQVVEYCEPAIYVPNSFTPNNDGANDYFRAYGENIDEFEMTILNRWGEPVFQSFDIDHGWDGSFLAGDFFTPDQSAPWIIRYKPRPAPGAREEHWRKLEGHVIILR